MLADYLAALGWQGGTIWQAVAEIKRLRNVEEAARGVLDQLSFRAGCGGLRFNHADEKALKTLGDFVKARPIQ